MEELDVLGELEAAEEYIESWEEAFGLFHKAGILKRIEGSDFISLSSPIEITFKGITCWN